MILNIVTFLLWKHLLVFNTLAIIFLTKCGSRWGGGGGKAFLTFQLFKQKQVINLPYVELLGIQLFIVVSLYY